MDALLAAPSDDAALFKAFVNTPFTDKLLTTKLALGIVVFLMVNKAEQTIDRIALSDTEMAKGAVEYSEKPFEEIKIPVGYPTNIIAQALESGQYKYTEDWQYMFNPALTPESARFNQAGAGIACSVVYPLTGRDGGAMIFSYYQPLSAIGDDHHQFMGGYAALASKHFSR